MNTLSSDGVALALAALEGAIKEVYMLPESTALDPHALARDMETLRLAPRTASRLLTLGYNANAYLAAFRENAPIPARRKKAFVLSGGTCILSGARIFPPTNTR